MSFQDANRHLKQKYCCSKHQLPPYGPIRESEGKYPRWVRKKAWDSGFLAMKRVRFDYEFGKASKIFPDSENSAEIFRTYF